MRQLLQRHLENNRPQLSVVQAYTKGTLLKGGHAAASLVEAMRNSVNSKFCSDSMFSQTTCIKCVEQACLVRLHYSGFSCRSHQPRLFKCQMFSVAHCLSRLLAIITDEGNSELSKCAVFKNPWVGDLQGTILNTCKVYAIILHG